MSNALAIAGVTAVLKDLLDDGMIDHKVTDAMGQGVTVSAIAPDEITVGADQQPRLNLFLYQATPNAAWRNFGLPSVGPTGTILSNSPLALDLHYMVTAYGSADLQAEILLGYAMLLFHETPVLTRASINRSLAPTPPISVSGSLLPSAYQSLRAADLANQIEQIKITPEVMNTEELSKLWTAIQSHYRPTATYLATVVLIEPRNAVSAPLPVLSRGPRDPVSKRETGPVVLAKAISPFPAISSIVPPAGRIAAQLGDTITVDGQNLTGANLTLVAANVARGFNLSMAAAPAPAPSAASVTFAIPDDPVHVAAGLYSAVLQLNRGGDPSPIQTNQAALVIQPVITGLPATAALAADGSLTLTANCSPQVQSIQQVSLILDDIAAVANPFTGSIANPTFVFPAAPPGKYWVRLRVDGVDSPLIANGPPPSFSAPRITVTP